MPSRDLETLADAQRETVRALAVLAERFESAARLDNKQEPEEAREVTRLPGLQAVLRTPPPGLETALENTSRVVSELSQNLSANTQALGGLSRQLGSLPGLLAGLASGVKGGGSLLGGVLKSGLGVASLGLRVAGLFRSEQGGEPVALRPYVDPPALVLEAANTQGIFPGVPRIDRSQQGEVRTIEQERPAVWQPQVSVTVNAMDSQSFLDRSEDIARALRQAMLHMHPVNDLISEL